MSTLSEILPTTPRRLIDLVKAAGVDVSDWGNFAGGEKNAAKNPKYCYEWSFIEPQKVVVLNLWHSLMEEKDSGIVMRNINMREFAAMRAGPEKRRAFKMDDAIQLAIKDQLPIRVIVLGGRRRNINNPGEKASHVSKRLLDPAIWTVTAYDSKSGQCTLTRGVHSFVDQFSIQNEPPKKPEKRDVSGQVFVRSPIVRGNVLLRANGKCEWCNQTGFIMADGRIYLETHHVISLSEKGFDVESNVAALCPNHHREVHHGAIKAEMRKKLLSRLNS